MRPIMLDMHGFASFREPTRVDFGDAEFFALVGPTGSGKSTVIDAMTFALYGSVPRWGRKGMVSLALAPTVDRGTVKLVFEIDGDRYVVARELRRAAGKASAGRDGGGRVSQRAASLEKLADPRGLAEPGEKTEPLAKDVDGVTDTVAMLLGLSYEDFIQCVVLPQGQFADFLHAKPGDRQEILLRLLGAEHYKQMMMKANQRAAEAGQRAGIIADSLQGYADATPEALASAVAAETAVAALGEKVAAALPKIRDAQAGLSAAQEKLRILRAEHAALSALRVPDDAAAIDTDLARARDALAELRAGERRAEDADTAARDALASGPQRAPLEMARERRAERARLAGSVPVLEARATEASGQAKESAATVEAAERDLEQARERRDAAAREAEAADQRVTRLRAECEILSSVTVPDGVTELDTMRSAAATALASAGRELQAAEHAEAAARQAHGALVPHAPLLQVRGDLDQVHDLLADLAAGQRAAAAARAEQGKADRAVAAAEAELAERRAALEDARRAHVVASLRPHLVTGEACPLCEQTITVVPAADDTLLAGKAARAAADDAEQALKRAQAVAGDAGKKTVRAQSTLDSTVSRGNGLLASLATVLAGPLAAAPLTATRALAERRFAPDVIHSADDLPDAVAADGAAPRADADTVARARGETAALLKDRERAEREADQAAREADTARKRHREAQARRDQAEAELAAAREGLRAARDPLVQFGAPQPAVGVDGGASLAEAWAALSGWAEQRSRERSALLAEARQAAEKADGDRAASVKEFTAADRARTQARDRAEAAAAAEQRARAQLSHTAGRVTELDELLAGAPAEDEITERLATLGRLEAEAEAAAKALRETRAARAGGEQDLAARERAETAARGQLSAARDRVVSLGAPVIESDTGLLDGWTTLVTWAQEQAETHKKDIGAATASAGRAQQEVATLAGQLSADLAAAGITTGSGTADPASPEVLVDSAQAAVAAERERARAATARITERRAEAAGLLTKQKEAQEEQGVAKLLGDLLRANAFQRWLVNAALDDLVTEASATLAALSSGQFDLSYDDGDFYVVDHSDADSRRSVRTLSGGETFQASLALALALSTQISALAATGAARLDSIFLDEGFGTLDPETLDVVATTLETLAQSDRMVGVVTHVGALAERVPVRFRVTRNTRTSVVTREGLEHLTPEDPLS